MFYIHRHAICRSKSGPVIALVKPGGHHVPPIGADGLHAQPVTSGLLTGLHGSFGNGLDAVL